jgi:DNA recombination protein RmuC
MQYILPAIAITFFLLALGLLAAVYRRTARGGGASAEAELREKAAAAEAIIADLRARLADLEAEAEDLRSRLAREQSLRVTAETRLEGEQKNLAEQRRLLDDAQVRLKDAFAALSAEALRASSDQFLDHAGQRLKPIQDLLRTYEQRLAEVERARNDAYGGLKGHLESLARAHQSLEREASGLKEALRSPTVRGRWGEMTLRRVVEVAGMSPHCDFQEQASVTTEDGRLRPDMLIRLPGGRTIVVDSKVPLAAYMDAADAAADAPARQAALERHAADVRKHVRALSGKAYWAQFPQDPDFVVLFLPGESFFSAALEHDRSLMEDAMQSRVFLATPTTLMALLNVVSHGWRQQEMAENAERIGQTGRELFDRVCKFMEHFGKLGHSLTAASRAYDAAVGSYESRVRPAAERLAQQAAVGGKELPAVDPAVAPSRELALPEGETPEAPPA